MAKIRELGGDLVIIVFACNFHIDGAVNEDITEANFRFRSRHAMTIHIVVNLLLNPTV
jgi:hypothetical protein